MTRDEGAEVSQHVKALYDDVGWKEVGDGITYDAQTWEDLRPVAQEYIAETRRRVMRHLPSSGERLLDMASGPIQYPEYLEFSKGFKTRVCVDLSQRALDMARAKIGDHGEYHCGDFLDLEIALNSMDAVVSLHTVYHIHASRQPAVVRKLIDVAKPGANVIVVYSNPHNLVSTVARPIRKLLGRPKPIEGNSSRPLYFDPQPLTWWTQFSDVADVTIYPWRSLSTPVQKALVPSGRLGLKVFDWLFKAEDRFPSFFVRLGCYPMVVLHKRGG